MLTAEILGFMSKYLMYILLKSKNALDDKKDFNRVFNMFSNSLELQTDNEK